MPKILIVDDDRTTVKLLKTLLELDGFEVWATGRGQDAFGLASEKIPDALLIDFNLSDMQGVQLVRQLRASTTFAQTPIVMASGLDMEHDALQAGASAFLVKPFEPSKLVELLQTLIG